MEILVLLGVVGLFSFGAVKIAAHRGRKDNAITMFKSSGMLSAGTYKRKARQEAQREWTNEYIKASRDALASVYGLPYDELTKYVQLLETIKKVQGFAQSTQYTVCTEQGDTYTVRTLDGSIVQQYTTRCGCGYCLHRESKDKLKVIEEKKTILEGEYTRRYQNFVPVSEEESLINSYNQLTTDIRGELPYGRTN